MGSLQVRLFLTYFVIIGVTLGLTALSLFLLLGGYRDSISYGNLEDVGALINEQARLEIQNGMANGAGSGSETPPPGSANEVDDQGELLLLLSQFLNRREADGSFGQTSVAVVDSSGRVLQAASQVPLEGAVVRNLKLPADEAPPSEREPRRCRLDVPSAPDLLCVSMALGDPVLQAFPDTDAAAIIVAQPAAGLGEVLGDLMPRLLFSGL
ncbi:MAG: hypothetical protein ACM3S1_03765, partial [Hyphomicrobiales bacterium]